MREILFRGKRINGGGWAEGSYIYAHKWGFDGSDGHLIGNIYATVRTQVAPETVGQFTGLHDKNGKQIFEGDIILFEDESPSNYEYHDCTEMRCGEMKFADGQFYLTNRIAVEMGDLIYDEKLDGVIVGNIHDNPELLERSNENAE